MNEMDRTVVLHIILRFSQTDKAFDGFRTTNLTDSVVLLEIFIITQLSDAPFFMKPFHCSV